MSAPKSHTVRLRFRGSWFLFAFVAGVESRELMFSGEGNARQFTRTEAAQVIRHWRADCPGRYYALEVQP